MLMAKESTWCNSLLGIYLNIKDEYISLTHSKPKVDDIHVQF